MRMHQKNLGKYSGLMVLQEKEMLPLRAPLRIGALNMNLRKKCSYLRKFALVSFYARECYEIQFVF